MKFGGVVGNVELGGDLFVSHSVGQHTEAAHERLCTKDRPSREDGRK